MVSTKNVGGHQDGRSRDGFGRAVACDVQWPAVFQHGAQTGGSTEVPRAGCIFGGGGAFAWVQCEPAPQMGAPISRAWPLDEPCPGGGKASSSIGEGKDGGCRHVEDLPDQANEGTQLVGTSGRRNATGVARGRFGAVARCA